MKPTQQTQLKPAKLWFCYNSLFHSLNEASLVIREQDRDEEIHTAKSTTHSIPASHS